MAADGARLREAVEAVIAEGRVLTRDLGGSASTTEAAGAVLEALFAA
jgi:3-isopropylmalate dehydrogenase